MPFGIVEALGVAGLALNVLSGKKARDTQKKAQSQADQATAKQKEAAGISNYITAVDAIRQYRQARAAVISGSINSGAGIGSSGVQGVTSSLESQVRGNLANFKKLNELDVAAKDYLSGAQRTLARGNTTAQLLGIAGDTALSSISLIDRIRNKNNTSGINQSPFITQGSGSGGGPAITRPATMPVQPKVERLG